MGVNVPQALSSLKRGDAEAQHRLRPRGRCAEASRVRLILSSAHRGHDPRCTTCMPGAIS